MEAAITRSGFTSSTYWSSITARIAVYVRRDSDSRVPPATARAPSQPPTKEDPRTRRMLKAATRDGRRIITILMITDSPGRPRGRPAAQRHQDAHQQQHH